MELIYLAFVLFILGVSGTLVYDKYKDQILAKLKEVTTPSPKSARVPRQASANQSANSDIDRLLNEVRARARAGQSTVRVQRGSSVQTTSVQDLIKQLEKMKNDL